jgi:hypothetical protein
MSHFASTVTVAYFLFFALLATFISAAPADVPRELNLVRRHGDLNSTTYTDTTNTTNTTVTNSPTNSTEVDDNTSNVTGSVSTSSSTMSGRVNQFGDCRSVV